MFDQITTFWRGQAIPQYERAGNQHGCRDKAACDPSRYGHYDNMGPFARLRNKMKYLLFALTFTLLSAVPATATGIIPLSGTQQFDKDISPPAFLNGGIVNIYLATTTSPAPIFSDFALTTPLANPLTLNAAGRFPAIYVADGLYRIRVLNSASVLQFDDDNVAAVTAAISNTPVVVVASQLWNTGDVKVRYDDQPADGFVRANGRTIGSATSGGSERANADCEALFKFLWGFANITLPAGKGASAAADWSANKQLTLPDMAGRLIGARDDLGAGVKSRITALNVTGPTLAGAVGGFEFRFLTQAYLPAINFTVSGITLADAGHNHTTRVHNASNSSAAPNGLFPGAVAGGTPNIYNATSDGSSSFGSTFIVNNTSGVSVATQGVAASGGSSSAMPVLNPVMLFTTYLKL